MNWTGRRAYRAFERGTRMIKNNISFPSVERNLKPTVASTAVPIRYGTFWNEIKKLIILRVGFFLQKQCGQRRVWGVCRGVGGRDR